MHAWKLKALLFTTGWMLVMGDCLSQVQQRNRHVAQAHSSATPLPTTPEATRDGSPTPYRAPIAVPSAAGAFSPLAVPAPTIVVIPPAPPRFIGNCDSAGCWGSDGTRYNAVGGSLVRPDGRACQSVGGSVNCP